MNFSRIIILFIAITGYSILTGNDIVINEVQYQNDSTLFANDGKSYDWIELYNPTNESINLKGYRLSDNENLEDVWVLPNIQLRANEFLLIYASGLDKSGDKEFHTNFKLKLMEDPLFLLNPKGEIIDSIEIQCIPPDNSLACFPNGSNQKYILSPTPGKSNNSAEQININFQTDTLILSHQSGFYNNDISLEISNRNNENTVAYTLNGDDPEHSSIQYHSPIYLTDISLNENRFADKTDNSHPGNLISKANIVRAQVYSEGCPASKSVSNVYFINSENRFNYNVPVVSIITDENNLFDDEIGIYVAGNKMNYHQRGKDWERPVHIEIFDSSKNKVIEQDAGVRIHGRGSRGGPQKSLRLYARNKYGDDQFSYPFFNQKPHLNSFKTMLLRTTRGWSGTMFKDELCQYIVQDMNLDYTASETVVLFLNGEYWGIYSLRERHDEHYVANNFAIPAPEMDVIAYEPAGPRLESGTIDEYNNLLAFLETENPNSENFYEEISDVIDIDALIDFYIAQLYLANSDFPNNNMELWKIRNDTAKWRYFFFDMDGSMIRVNYNHLSEYNNTIDELQRFDDFATVILRTLLKNQDINNMFNARFNWHLNNTFRPSRVINIIDDFQKKYEPLANEQIYRWANPVDYNKWLHNVDMLRLFAMQRNSVMHNQVNKNFGTPFTMFPNPTAGELNLNFNELATEKTIEIFDSQGRIVWNETGIMENNIQMNTLLGKGVYTLRVKVNLKYYSQQLVIL